MASHSSLEIPSGLTPYLQSCARIIFGFLIVRHGMEQVFVYPEASDLARMSFGGILELIAFPAGILIMLGLFTRPVSLVLAVMYLTFFFLVSVQIGPFTH